MYNAYKKYRFFISIDGGEAVETKPIWEQSLTRVTEKEDSANGAQFYRQKISGKLIFSNQYFDLINDADFESEFVVTIETFENDAWTLTDTGFFNKTDCDFDLDTCSLSVELERRDEYENVMAGMDKEFNIIDLPTRIETIKYKKQPLLQVYSTGLDFLTSYLGSTYFETPVTGTADNFEITDLGFENGLPSDIVNFVTGTGANLSPDVSGVYEVVAVAPSGSAFQRLDGKYRFDRIVNGSTHTDVIIDLENSNTVVYESEVDATGFAFSENKTTFQGFDILTSVTDNNSQCQLVRVETWMRLLTDNETVGGETTDDFDADNDFADTDFGYTKVLPIENEITTGVFDGAADAGSFGKFPDDVANFAGQYYTDLILPNENTFPLSPSEWAAASVWFAYNDNLRALQEDGAKEFILNDAYRLSSIITALLNEIAPEITHDETIEYSEFLYSAINPISGDVQPELLVTPVSNITIGDYTKAATRANIRLSEVFQMLWTTYKVGWYIEDNKLKFEHISFFENGGNYVDVNVGENLTIEREPKTAKKWSFATNKYKYEKQELPEQIVTKWSAANASVPFYGHPINVTSKYVQDGKIDENVVPRFYTDIDYLIANPDNISADTLLLMGAIETGGSYEVPFLEFSIGANRTFVMQNGYLSFIYLHEKFYRHSLPAKYVNINERETEATTVKRAKIQEIDYPIDSNFNPLELIKTGLGDGQIKSVTENLSSETAKITILHDTE